MSVRSFVTVFGLLASIATVSCGMNGGDVHGGYHVLEDSGHHWRVWYLSPPWVLDMQMLGHATLHVPAMENPGTQPALMHASLALTFDATGGPVATEIASRAARAMIPGDAVIIAPRPVMFANVTGTETVIGGPEHEVRIAAAPLGSGSIVLTFESTNPLGANDEVTEMIGLVETM